jgi:NADH-quinone oxidoreductase subunit N
VPIAAAAYSSDTQIGSTVAYALMYAVVNLGAFAVAALVSRTHPGGRLTDYRGLYARSPLAALALGFFLLCLAGLPPGIIGLFAKVTVFSSAVDAGLAWLAVVMAVNVVIALYYYLRWTALLFRPAPAQDAARAPQEAPQEGLQEAPQEERTGRLPLPAPLGTAIVLTLTVGIALSGAPQLVLRFATGTLFP